MNAGSPQDSRRSDSHGRQPTDVLLRVLDEQILPDGGPVFVGIDGRSGAGKSTLAAAVASGLAGSQDGTTRVSVIDGDDFYAGGSGAAWDRRSAAQNAERVMDWRTQREVLEQLRGTGIAEWQAFDWDAENWDDEVAPLATVPTVATVAPVVILDGTYSCRPELHDLLDLRVMLDVPYEIRRRRLLDREAEDHEIDWDRRWEAAEDHYFGAVMPPERFDLVLFSDQ